MVRMTNKEIAEGKFRRASDDASAAKLSVSTPQTESEAYKLAFQDTEFLLREDLRPVRFQLELLKPELLLDEAKIESTFVFYGSARIPHPDKANVTVEKAQSDYDRKMDERLADQADRKSGVSGRSVSVRLELGRKLN